MHGGRIFNMVLNSFLMMSNRVMGLLCKVLFRRILCIYQHPILPHAYYHHQHHYYILLWCELSKLNLFEAENDKKINRKRCKKHINDKMPARVHFFCSSSSSHYRERMLLILLSSQLSSLFFPQFEVSKRGLYTIYDGENKCQKNDIYILKFAELLW